MSAFKPTRYEVQLVKDVANRCERAARLAQQGWHPDAPVNRLPEMWSREAFALAQRITEREA